MNKKAGKKVIKKDEDKILEKAIGNKKSSSKERIKIYVSKKQFWQALSVVLALMFVFSLVIFYSNSAVGGSPSKAQVQSNVLKFVKAKLISPGVKVDLLNFTEEKGLYKIVLNLSLKDKSQEVTSYVTKSGDLFFPQAIEVPKEFQTAEPVANNHVNSNIVKSDKPVVEAFVMAYCPYGTQIEKGLIPVVKALGDKIDFNVKFVYYSMHGKKELDEQLRQYCIETEYNDKYLDYLGCFLSDANSTRCLAQVGLNESSLSDCVASTDAKYNVTGLYEDKSTWLSGRFPLFNVFKEENVKYGVQGSPTLVINGVNVNTNRDSASLLKVICSAFNNKPEECNTKLSSTAYSPGFGYEAGSGSNSGSCG